MAIWEKAGFHKVNQEKKKQVPAQKNIWVVKVHLSWEGHKILQNLHQLLDWQFKDKLLVEISQNFVAFSECMNFTILYF